MNVRAALHIFSLDTHNIRCVCSVDKDTPIVPSILVGTNPQLHIDKLIAEYTDVHKNFLSIKESSFFDTRDPANPELILMYAFLLDMQDLKKGFWLQENLWKYGIEIEKAATLI